MAPSPSSTGTVLERIAVADAGSQTTDDMIDVLIAEAIVAEALQVGDELAAKQAEAEQHASQLDCALSKAQAQLGRADQRAKCENAAKEAAERRAEDWQAEALAILNVTHKSPKWLLLQVHPDKHLDDQAAAKAAVSRVNQARDVRCKHVTDWTQ